MLQLPLTHAAEMTVKTASTSEGKDEASLSLITACALLYAISAIQPLRVRSLSELAVTLTVQLV